MAADPIIPEITDAAMITTLVFQLRSVPAALYKALGGFATNGINLTKLESYFIVATCPTIPLDHPLHAYIVTNVESMHMC